MGHYRQQSVSPTGAVPQKRQLFRGTEKRGLFQVRCHRQTGGFGGDLPPSGPLYNYRHPSFRLIDKVKQADGRYKKVYKKQTPLSATA
jgi:hypothetical protein